MPEDRSPPQEAGIKPSNKHKWRGKLFSTESRFGKGIEDLESTEDDVANFLHSTVTKPKARPQPTHLTPRLDTSIAPRFPTATVTPEPPTETVDVYRRPKPRQNKGLHVAFHAAAPEIIGEGGDEAELPSKEVSRSLQRTTQPDNLLLENLATKADDETTRSGRQPSPSVESPAFEPKILRRTPTGLSEIFDDQILESRDQDQETGSLSSSASPPAKLKPLPRPPSQVRHQHHDESDPLSEGILPNVSPLTDRDDDFDGVFPSQTRAALGPTVSKNLEIPSPEILAGNSITPRSSPQPPIEYHEGESSRNNYPTAAFSSYAMPVASKSNQITNSQAMTEGEENPNVKNLSLRQVAKDLGDDALDEFDARVQRFNSFFGLGISAYTDVTKVSFIQWIRTACWWFLKGRQALENEVRGNPQGSFRTDISSTLKQAYVDLAKSWWIVKEITPNHPEVAGFGKASMNSLCAIIKSSGDQSLVEQAEVHTHIVASLRALAMSMKRNGKLPPPDLEIQRLNLNILLKLPQIPEGIVGLLVNNSSTIHAQGILTIERPFFPIPIADTERHFNFGRMFVEISKGFGKTVVDLYVPCVLTVLRDRNEWNMQATIASQDGQVNLIISDEMTNAFSWRNVQWQIESHEVLLTMPSELKTLVKLQIKFVEKDFKTLWGICDYMQKARKAFAARKDEDLIFERTLRKFQCDDATNFQTVPVDDCRLRLFESKRTLTELSVERQVHNGYRLTVMSPPSMKALSIAKYDLGRENPILLGIHTGDNTPNLLVRVLPSLTRISLSFSKAEDVDAFRHLLGGTMTTKEDRTFPPLQLQNLTIHSKKSSVESTSVDSALCGDDFPWKRIRIVQPKSPSHGPGNVPKGLVNLRLLVDSEFGTLTDRINVAAGELQLGLSNENFNELKILRPPQTDMTWSLADQRAPKKDVTSVCEILKTMLANPTIRTYHFRALEDLHNFQTVMTGFSVSFDRLVSSFAIARRRAVLPVHKKWEASSVRLQIVKQEKNVQLIAFFTNFIHGTCVNFVLKTTDVFEVFSKGGLFFLRIVDAKFPLPKRTDDELRDFVNVAMPEYPGEHDDITIGFDNEPDRDNFVEVLPAPVNTLSRIASLRR